MTAAHPPPAVLRTDELCPVSAAPRLGPHARRPLPLRVGSRASPLALVQTRAFLSQIAHFCPVLRAPGEPEDVPVFVEHAIRTTGDAVQNRRLAEIGGKGLFAKEIHEALADGRIDMAVHSLKDLETALPPGIVLACTLAREDARDALILPASAEPLPTRDDPFATIPSRGAVDRHRLGAAAGAAAGAAGRTCAIGLIRGNVQTRLDRVACGRFRGHAAGAGGACAGWAWTSRASVVLHPDDDGARPRGRVSWG